MRIYIDVLRLAALGAMLAAGGISASAQEVPVPSPAEGGTVSGSVLGTEAADRPGVSIEGFRSARFGMDEAAVREALAADFGIEEDAVSVAQNPAERTRILTVGVPNVLEEGGTADVSYVFGYRTGELAQVSVLWSAETDSEIDGDRLVANANVLQSYFLQSGYRPETVIANAAVPEGLIMFRGTDGAGRMTVLLLRGTLSVEGGEGEAGQPVLTPTSLLLAYLADPENPDVFSVEPGQF